MLSEPVCIKMTAFRIKRSKFVENQIEIFPCWLSTLKRHAKFNSIVCQRRFLGEGERKEGVKKGDASSARSNFRQNRRYSRFTSKLGTLCLLHELLLAWGLPYYCCCYCYWYCCCCCWCCRREKENRRKEKKRRRKRVGREKRMEELVERQREKSGRCPKLLFQPPSPRMVQPRPEFVRVIRHFS